MVANFILHSNILIFAASKIYLNLLISSRNIEVSEECNFKVTSFISCNLNPHPISTSLPFTCQNKTKKSLIYKVRTQSLLIKVVSFQDLKIILPIVFVAFLSGLQVNISLL